MPNWTPNWVDVEWDHSAAKEAIRKLNKLATFLDDVSNRQRNIAAQAKKDWLGKSRNEFDMRFNIIKNNSATLVIELRKKASEIREADRLAYEEQKRRERERERWFWEKSMEAKSS